MRPACLMLAQLVCKVCCPAIVDQRTGVERNDAERVDGFLAPLAMQELERQDTVAGYVQPPVLLVDPDAGFISMKGRACQKVLLVEKRATLTLQEGSRRPNLTPYLVVKTPSSDATKEMQPGIICIERKGWIVSASWSSCSSSSTVVLSHRVGQNWTPIVCHS